MGAICPCSAFVFQAIMPDMAVFELKGQHDALPAAPTGWAGLETSDLLRNARWFTLIRWAIIAAFSIAALIQGAWPKLCAVVGVCLPGFPLLMMAEVLAVTNLFYILVLRRYTEATPRKKLLLNLWLQILLDLAVLTVLVHLSGSLTTFVSLAYIFHIVLACIFFAPPYSLLVTLLSSLLFLSVVALELMGVLDPCNMLVNAPPAPSNLVTSPSRRSSSGWRSGISSRSSPRRSVGVTGSWPRQITV